MPVNIRKAVISDIEAIHRLLNHYADEGLLLPRSLSELYDHLRDFVVLEENDPDHRVLGVCGLRICWDDLAEIKSLAVVQHMHGEGMGTRLVETCIREARSLGLKRVFTLTYVPAFFRKLGFGDVEKSVLPHKIWADCLNCPKFPNCDETALMIEL
ncbi:MAG: N-acetyltransferase [Deltaproteobacteria bacterium]|nr:N-acetyltransferase [Deltaproteobacteria bacterium]